MAEGFTFPLNPKWILCDAGWHDVYQSLCESPSAQQSLDAWLPPSSQLRERIAAVHAAHPAGFVRVQPAEGEAVDDDGGVGDMALAELALKRHQTLRRAKMKLRFTFKLAQMARESKRKLAGVAAGDDTPPTEGNEDVTEGVRTVETFVPRRSVAKPLTAVGDEEAEVS